MTANNSCGGRSIHYGIMVDNVEAIDAILVDGTEARFGHVPGNLGALTGPERYRDLVQAVRAIADRESAEIDGRMPKLMRRVGGYNLDRVIARDGRSEEHTSELQSLMRLSYAVFCLKKKKRTTGRGQSYRI